jgi:hypothetical protein
MRDVFVTIAALSLVTAAFAADMAKPDEAKALSEKA